MQRGGHRPGPVEFDRLGTETVSAGRPAEGHNNGRNIGLLNVELGPSLVFERRGVLR